MQTYTLAVARGGPRLKETRPTSQLVPKRYFGNPTQVISKRFCPLKARVILPILEMVPKQSVGGIGYSSFGVAMAQR